jgi:hypothetical protein
MRNRNRRIQRSNVALKALPTLFFAGRAVLTFQNLEKETHMTVKVSQARDKQDRKKLLPMFHVKLKLLGDSLGWVYVGTVFTDSGNWSLDRRTRPDSQAAKVFGFLRKAVAEPESLRGKVNLFHEGHCCKCGLPLTHPESISTAIGPKCLKVMIAAQTGFRPDDLFEAV